MRKLLNTLYVTTPGAYLSKDGLNVVISVENKEIFRIPIVNLEGIVTFGYSGASPGLMKLCADSSVSLVFLSPYGRYIGRFQGQTRGNVLLRMSQYQISRDSARSLHIAKLMIAGKIQNQRNVLRRFIRDNGELPEVVAAAEYLENAKQKALSIVEVDSLRGIEGDCASVYFGVFHHLILNQKEDFVAQGEDGTIMSEDGKKTIIKAWQSRKKDIIEHPYLCEKVEIGLIPYIQAMLLAKYIRNDIDDYPVFLFR